MLKIYFVRYVIGILCLSSLLCADVLSSIEIAPEVAERMKYTYDWADNFCRWKED